MNGKKMSIEVDKRMYSHLLHLDVSIHIESPMIFKNDEAHQLKKHMLVWTT